MELQIQNVITLKRKFFPTYEFINVCPIKSISYILVSHYSFVIHINKNLVYILFENMPTGICLINLNIVITYRVL